MEKFIYIFNHSDRDDMIKCGFDLVHEDERSNIYVFVNRKEMQFSLSGKQYVLSNILTF